MRTEERTAPDVEASAVPAKKIRTYPTESGFLSRLPRAQLPNTEREHHRDQPNHGPIGKSWSANSRRCPRNTARAGGITNFPGKLVLDIVRRQEISAGAWTYRDVSKSIRVRLKNLPRTGKAEEDLRVNGNVRDGNAPGLYSAIIQWM